jgi:hypothetical protein
MRSLQDAGERDRHRIRVLGVADADVDRPVDQTLDRSERLGEVHGR